MSRRRRTFVRRVETWLQEDGRLRRPLSKEKLSKQDFEEQRHRDVEYVIFRRVKGTYSDGKGGRPRWEVL